MASVIFTSACKKTSDSEAKSMSADGLKIYRYDGDKPVLEYLKEQGANPFTTTSNMMKAQVIHPGDEGLGWPEYPRTTLETGKKVMKDYEVYVGAKVGFMNFFETAAKEAVKVTFSAKSDVMLAKNTPDGERLFQDGVDGTRFELSDGRVFRAQCVYVSTSELSERFEYKLDAAGNGFVNGRTASQHIIMSTYSGFFDLSPEWTLPDLREFCDTVYVDRVRHRVAEDMVAAMNRSWETKHNDDATVKALDSVFYGGSLNRFGLHGHAFDVKKADKIIVNSDYVEIYGRIHHNINGACRNEEIDYRCVWDAGQKVRQKIKFGKTSTFCPSSWKNAAIVFARDICRQGYSEFSRPSQPRKGNAADALNGQVQNSQENVVGWDDF